MIDVANTSLSPEDKELLAHPLVGGLILFTRNFESLAQLQALTQNIRQNAGDIIIAVDHEGGRVQRFRDGFSKIPAMGNLWQQSQNDLAHGQKLAFSAGQVMALEVRAVGIDISFAPVLDVNGISDVIGDRAFHQEPLMVKKLAQAFIQGMNSVGMLATGKHFPGHGSVQEDSHIAMPVDRRTLAEITAQDLQPFAQLMEQKLLAAVMPAHIIFPDIDRQAVGFSSVWLQAILRKKLGFEGVIFSDDLSMQGASVAGGAIERAEAAQAAGCDMLLVCNDRAAAIEVIEQANINICQSSQHRIKTMMALPSSVVPWAQLAEHVTWQQAKQVLESLS